jgi:hypothetical protein
LDEILDGLCDLSVRMVRVAAENTDQMNPAGGRLRAGTPIVELSVEQLGAVFDHPAQRRTVQVVTDLIVQLRACGRPSDFFELQASLFLHAYEIDSRRASCVQMVKRLRGGRGLPQDAPEPPEVGDPSDAAAWEFEVFVHERLFRQFRAVGDGFAWAVFRYDRRVIAALASNASPGPLVKRVGSADESNGLLRELETVQDIWEERHNFALLHDLTNCLRIGDVTEVDSEGNYFLHEVKNNTRNRSRVQDERMRSAAQSIEHGTPLPGRKMRVVELKEPYRTDLGTLDDLVELANRRGSRGAKLSEGRAIIVTSIAGLANRSGGVIDTGTQIMTSARANALKRAGIDGDLHHLRCTSADQAARSPLLAPWSIYPLSPAVCAALICDLVKFETVLSTDSLIGCLERHGLSVELLIARTSGALNPKEPVLRMREIHASSPCIQTRFRRCCSSWSALTRGPVAWLNFLTDPSSTMNRGCGSPATTNRGCLSTAGRSNTTRFPEPPRQGLEMTVTCVHPISSVSQRMVWCCCVFHRLQ